MGLLIHGAMALGLAIAVQVMARAENNWHSHMQEVWHENKVVYKPQLKLPRPDDLKLNPDGQVSYNPEVYQLVDHNVDRKGRVTVQVKIKQRTAPDGTKYQVLLKDMSPDAKYAMETKYFQLPYTPPKLPGPDDLKIDSNGNMSYNPAVYQLLNYTFDETNLATIALKIKVKKEADGSEYQVHLDDDDPDTFEKIVYEHRQFPNKPQIYTYKVTINKTSVIGSTESNSVGTNPAERVENVFNITTNKVSGGATKPNSTFTEGTKSGERDGNCRNLPKNSTIYNPSTLNLPSYKLENSSINPDGSRTLYGYIRVWSPIKGGPKYVVPYYPRPADSEKLQVKIAVDKDGNQKIVKVWYLNEPQLVPNNGNSKTQSGVDPDRKNPQVIPQNQSLMTELLIFNKIWMKIQAENKLVKVTVIVKFNPDGTRTVVPFNPKPSPGCSIVTGLIVPGPNGTETVQLKTENNGKLEGSNNNNWMNAKINTTVGQQPSDPNGGGLNGNKQPMIPNLYNIPSFKELHSSTAPDRSRIIHAHIRVYQPIANSPWYTVQLHSKLPNSEKLRAKIEIGPDGTAKIRQIWCLPQDQVRHEICIRTPEESKTVPETSARKPTIDLSIQNKPWFQFLTKKTNPNDPTNNKVIIWLKMAENPNGTNVVLPLDSSTLGAVLKFGFLDKTSQNLWTFTSEGVQYVKNVSTTGSSVGQTTSAGWSQGSQNKKDSSEEEETTRKSQPETYVYPDETPSDGKGTNEMYFYTDEDQLSSPSPLSTKTPEIYVYPDENQPSNQRPDTYVYNDQN